MSKGHVTLETPGFANLGLARVMHERVLLRLVSQGFEKTPQPLLFY